jgi:hypothetical protein
MFGLTPADLAKRTVMDCSAGGSSFIAEAAGAGRTLRAAEFAAARYISCPFVRITCRSGPGI